MITINQKTIDATKRLIKFLKTSQNVPEAVKKLVSDKDHVQLTALECMPMDDIVTKHYGNRLIAIEKLEALLKSAEA